VEDGLKSGDTSPLKGTLASTILGGRKFVEEIEALHLSGVTPSRDLPNLRQLSCRWSIEDIVSAVEKSLGADKVLVRKVGMYLCHRHSGATLREIGKKFRVGESAVSQGSKRLRDKLAEDESLREEVERICLILGIVNV